MSDYFEATNTAASQGLSTVDPSAGAALVAGWAGELETLDSPAAKAVHGDLMQLHQELESGSPDSGRVTSILGKLGTATTDIADSASDPQVAAKLRSLGSALTAA